MCVCVCVSACENQRPCLSPSACLQVNKHACDCGLADVCVPANASVCVCLCVILSEEDFSACILACLFVCLPLSDQVWVSL